MRGICIGGGEYGSGASARPWDAESPRYVRITDIRDDGTLNPETRASIPMAVARPYMLKDGDLLFARSGATVGKTYLYQAQDGRCAHAGYVIKFQPDPNIAIPRYAFWWTQASAYWRWVNRTLRQGAQPNINATEYGAHRLLLPPLPEQRRIAEILDTLDEAIRKTEQVITKLQQMKQGLLHDLLTRGIDEHGELRDPERHPEQFKDSRLGRIPRGWEVRSLVSVAEVRSGIAKNSNKAVNHPVWVHYLRVANVQDGYLDLTEMSKIRIGRDEVERYAVRSGDVLMNEGGDLDKLGRGAIWRGQFDPCVHQNHVFVVRCGADLMPEYLDAWTGSPQARRYFLVAGKQTTNLASINKTALGKLPVAVPPMAEQEAIASALDQYDHRVVLEAQEVSKLRTLKQGLMDDLLTGRVRVYAPEEAAP